MASDPVAVAVAVRGAEELFVLALRKAVTHPGTETLEIAKLAKEHLNEVKKRRETGAAAVAPTLFPHDPIEIDVYVDRMVCWARKMTEGEIGQLSYAQAHVVRQIRAALPS